MSPTPWGGGACSYPPGTRIWGEGSASDVKVPTAFILFAESIGSGGEPYDKNKRPFNPASTAIQSQNTGDADQSADSQSDGAVYHNTGGGNVANLSQSANINTLEASIVNSGSGGMTASWEMHFPGRHSDGTNICFFDGHVKWFKDWVWNSMTMRRAGPFPQGDARNTQGL